MRRITEGKRLSGAGGGGARPEGSCARPGFTLIEVVLASALLALVGAAVSSTLLLASRATPRATGGSAVSARVSDVLTQLSLEIGSARLIRATEPAYFVFQIADMDEDGADEEVAYAFIAGAGGVGGQLLRAVNGTTTVVLEGITSCSFGYHTGSIGVRDADDVVTATTSLRAISIDITPDDGARMRETIRCASVPEVE